MRPSPLDAALLFDCYGELLTERQREAWRLYCLEDWSLAEIGERFQVSRAAVHDLLERTRRALGDYEAKLGLVAGWKRRREALAMLRAALASADERWPGRASAWTAFEMMAREEGYSDV
jgi:predicted DNA-binding protein YlxM (UPF0122 family)